MKTIYTLRSGGTAHPEDSVLQHLTDQTYSSGVYDLSGLHFQIQAQTVPDLTVKSVIGRAYILNSTTNICYPVRSDADETVTIQPNASGNPRIDAIVLYIDLSATANADSSNVAKLVAVMGTPAASPVAPTDSDILTAIGANNPFLRLANVAVASGATSIVNADITDTRVEAVFKVSKVQFQGGRLQLVEQSSTPTTPSSGNMKIYPKSDGKLYKLDDSGTEAEVGSASYQGYNNLIRNGNWLNCSTAGYGCAGTAAPDDWGLFAGGVGGAYPPFSKQDVIDKFVSTGVVDGDIEFLTNLNQTWNDLSSNGYNLTPANAPTDDSNGPAGFCKAFNGTTQYANVSAPLANISTSQTWIAVFRTGSSVVNDRWVCGFGTATPTDRKGIYIDSFGHFGFRADGLTGTTFTHYLYAEPDKWYVVEVRWDSVGQFLEFNVNGMRRWWSPVTGTMTTASSSFSVGRIGDYNAQYWNGKIQTVMILSKYLNDNENRKVLQETIFGKLKLYRNGTSISAYQFFNKAEEYKLQNRTLYGECDVYQTAPNQARVELNCSGTKVLTYEQSTTTGQWVTIRTKMVLTGNPNWNHSFSVVNTVDGNCWYRNFRVYTEGYAPFQPSPNDWSRFPSLLRWKIPHDLAGGYHFEENRWFLWTSLGSMHTFSGATTYGVFSDVGTQYMFMGNRLCHIKHRLYWGTLATANSTTVYLKLPTWCPFSDQTTFGSASLRPGTIGFVAGNVYASGDVTKIAVGLYNGGNAFIVGDYTYVWTSVIVPTAESFDSSYGDY